jgi:hypothetical protein
MPLPCPGPALISLADLQTEFGGSNPIGLGEYYRNGLYVGSNNTNVPTSGTISLNNFFCAVNEIVRYITATSTNVNASSYFTAGEWSSSAPKRLVINSGVTVGATSTLNYALTIPSGFGGSFRLDNNGSILGAGGAANSGTGGNAIFAGAPVSINNSGIIYSGGGGGGQGGTGGGGFFTYDCSYTQFLGSTPYGNFTLDCNVFCNNTFGGGAYCASGNNVPNCQFITYGFFVVAIRCTDCRRNVSQTCTTYTSGGIGGSGGVGRGYNQTQANGLGGAAGGTNAGTGGTGGTGGNWGTGGGNGFVGSNGNASAAPALGTSGGPAYGGLAGFYIVNNANVTWIATGTRAGRVG